MRAVIQRVESARVEIDGRVAGAIGHGFLVLLGMAPDDGVDDRDWIIRKLLGQKLFDDDDGRMANDVAQAGGGVLVVSQFTLLASTRKGTKPSWHRAAPPPLAAAMYLDFIAALRQASGVPVATGEFGAEMRVILVNDGPVTLILDSRLRE